MKRMVLVLVSSLSILAAANSVQAEVNSWEIDPAHSRFAFEIQHIFSTVYGYFGEYSGEVRFDPDKPEQSSMNFAVNVNSIQTFIGKRDNHLRSPDFFDVKSYPQMTFASTSISRTSAEQFDVRGKLTIKDVTEEVVLPFRFLGIAVHPADDKKEVAGFEARFPLDRLQYRVGDGKFHKMGIVGREVQVVVSLETLRTR